MKYIILILIVLAGCKTPNKQASSGKEYSDSLSYGCSGGIPMELAEKWMKCSCKVDTLIGEMIADSSCVLHTKKKQ